MAIQAKFYIDDVEINVLESSFSFKQNSDNTGRPTSKPIYVGLYLVVETRKDFNFMELTINPDRSKQLELHYLSANFSGKTRKIKFVDSHFVQHTTQYSSDGVTPMTETLFIRSGGVIDSNSGSEYSSHWRTTFPSSVPVTTVNEEQEEKKVIDYYITDLNNKRIDKILAGDKILLNIHSRNMIDELFTIKLSNQTIDFKYNGEVLIDDTLSNYKIGSNQEKIELEAIKQEV
ncbi:type VI secretion system tube protein TssD [uncultured Aquimarina sp.]|uniref:type VI secretion system tube protein TssD n=1 Tax=uncultured Aquimarina sp. TaxID=575652 RepID=UPI0026259A02|nr:type VI secretion system tube protein TssD [uncultured Aquimarina sp.]